MPPIKPIHLSSHKHIQFQRYELCVESNHIHHIHQINTYTTQKSTKPRQKTAIFLMVYWGSTASQTMTMTKRTTITDYDKVNDYTQTVITSIDTNGHISSADACAANTSNFVRNKANYLRNCAGFRRN